MDWVEGNLVRLHSAQVGLSGRGHPFVDIEIGVALRLGIRSSNCAETFNFVSTNSVPR